MPARPSRTPSVFQQLMAAASHAAMHPDKPRQWPMNPFPPGVRAGSMTEKVREAAKDVHPRWLEHHELMAVTGGSRGAIAWAVRYLQEHGLLRSIPSSRHPQYRRYQAVLAHGEMVGDADDGREVTNPSICAAGNR
jgi:hypothetical protein